MVSSFEILYVNCKSRIILRWFDTSKWSFRFTSPCPCFCKTDDLSNSLIINIFIKIECCICTAICLIISFQVVCASVKSNEVLIFDIGYVSSDPVAVNFCSYLLSHLLNVVCIDFIGPALFFPSLNVSTIYCWYLTPPNSVHMNFFLHYSIIVKPCPVFWIFFLIICC